jgi:hypothetical protein
MAWEDLAAEWAAELRRRGATAATRTDEELLADMSAMMGRRVHMETSTAEDAEAMSQVVAELARRQEASPVDTPTVSADLMGHMLVALLVMVAGLALGGLLAALVGL